MKTVIFLVILFISVIVTGCRSADAYFREGMTKFIHKDYEGAIPAYDKALEINSDHSDYSFFAVVYYYRAISKYNSGNNENALADINKCIGIAFDQQKCVGRGLSRKVESVDFCDLLMEGDYKERKHIHRGKYKEHLQKCKSEIYSNRAVIKFSLKDYKGALSDCNIAIGLGKKIYAIRGFTKKLLGDRAGAIADYKRALKYEKNRATIAEIKQMLESLEEK